MTTAHERAEFVGVLVRELPDHSIGAVAELAGKLIRLAIEYDKIQTRACNGESRPTDDDREKAIEERARKLLDGLGIAVKFGGDPRGFTMRLTLKSGLYNTWGGAEEGWGVPC